MKFEYIIQNYVGSTTRFQSSVNDIDVRFFFINDKAKFNFHTKKYNDELKKTIDTDRWEISVVLNQILNGEDCAPFLFNTITSPIYKSPTELGLELIKNKDRLIGKPLIDGAIKYSQRKVSLANGTYPLPENKSSTSHKQVYYACSDLMELYHGLNNDLTYPLKLEKNIFDIKENNISYNESIEILEDIKLRLLSLSINDTPDIKWCENFIKNCYNHYIYL
jgi:predicted nucleotidyltransferase